MSYVIGGEAASAYAFNLGCDARLAGRPLRANPFCPTNSAHLWQCWARGWRHVQKDWASLVRDRWRVRPLPPVVFGGAPC